MERENSRNRRTCIVTIVLFMGLLFAFGLGFFLAPDRAYSERENRYLQQQPPLVESSAHPAWEALLSGAWMEDYEAYVNDQFPLRDEWIVAQAVMQNLAGRRDNNGVYFPKESIFRALQGDEGAHSGAPLIETFWHYDAARYRQNLTAVVAYARSAAAAGEKVYFLPVPNAVSVTTRKPGLGPDVDQEWLLDEMREEVEKAIFVDVLGQLREGEEDLRLQPAEEEGDLSSVYYRTDHHLNMSGSFLLYQELMRAIGAGETEDAALAASAGETDAWWTPLEKEDFDIRVAKGNFTGTLYNKSGAWWTAPDSMMRWELNRGGQEKMLRRLEDIPREEAGSGKNSTARNAEAEAEAEAETEKEPLLSWQVELPKSGKRYDSIYNEAALQQPDPFSFYGYGNQPVLLLRRNVSPEEAIGSNGAASDPKKLLIIKDSYAHQILPFLACHYDEIHMLDLRYFHESVAAYKQANGLDSTLILYNLSNFCGDENIPLLGR